MFRTLFLMVLILMAVLVSMMAGASPAMACRGDCAAIENTPAFLTALDCSRESEQRQSVHASLPEPLKNPADDCRCQPYHSSQVGCLPPVLTTGLEKSAPLTFMAHGSTLDHSTPIVRPWHPPNISFVDVFLINSILQI